MKTLEVEYVPVTHFVPVIVQVHTGEGHYEYIESSKLKFYRNALGLLL